MFCVTFLGVLVPDDFEKIMPQIRVKCLLALSSPWVLFEQVVTPMTFVGFSLNARKLFNRNTVR